MRKGNKPESISNVHEITQPIFLYLPLEIARDLMDEAHKHKGRTPSTVLVERLHNGYYTGTGPHPRQEIEIALSNLERNITKHQIHFGGYDLNNWIDRLSNSSGQKG